LPQPIKYCGSDWRCVTDLSVILKVSPNTIRYWFSVGCPQASISEIRHWKRARVRKYHANARLKRFLSKKLDVTERTIETWISKGLDITLGLQRIRRWRKGQTTIVPENVAQDYESGLLNKYMYEIIREAIGATIPTKPPKRAVEPSSLESSSSGRVGGDDGLELIYHK